MDRIPSRARIESLERDGIPIFNDVIALTPPASERENHRHGEKNPLHTSVRMRVIVIVVVVVAAVRVPFHTARDLFDDDARQFAERGGRR